MNYWKLLTFTGILGLLGACVLREAEPSAKQEVFLFTDELTETDSSLIKEFEKSTKCNVRIVFLSPEEYLTKVGKNRFNTGADVLWFSNDSVREKLYQSSHLMPIDNKEWNNLEGEFYVKHQLWFPICHDPLVLTKAKDSTDCANINFNTWHKKDSISPKYIYPWILPKYKYAIEKTALNGTLVPNKNRKIGNEYIWNLSSLAKKYTEVDSTFNKNKYFCKQLISVNKRHITQLSCLYLAKYARNRKNGDLLIGWLVNHHKQISSARNELSCTKNVTPSYTIKQLALLF